MTDRLAVGPQANQSGPAPAAPTNFATDAQREQWERQQYEKCALHHPYRRPAAAQCP